MGASTDVVDTTRTFGNNKSPWVSVFNLCNAAIGAGVLSFPFGFRKTGVLGGLFFTGVIWVIEVFALCLLVRVTERYKSQSYQQLVRSALGPQMAVLTSLVMLILLFGGSISYLLITGDVFTSFFGQHFEEYPILTNRSLVITFFAIVIILPLALKTTLKALKYSSVISVAMLTYLTIVLVVLGVNKIIAEGLPSNLLVWKAGTNALIMIDIVVFAFQCHIQVVPIFAELAENPNPFFGSNKSSLDESLLDDETKADMSRKGRSERVKRMDGVIFLSLSICLIGYCLVGEFGYFYDQNVPSDVLNSDKLPTNAFVEFARIGMAVVAMVCYPLQSHPARSIVEDAIKAVSGISVNSFSWTRHIGITFFYFLSTLAVALSIKDLSTVFQVVGSTGGVMVVFIIPGILLIRGMYSVPDGDGYHAIDEEEGVHLFTRSQSQKFVEITGGIFIITLGCLIFVATSYVNFSGLVPKE